MSPPNLFFLSIPIQAHLSFALLGGISVSCLWPFSALQTDFLLKHYSHFLCTEFYFTYFYSSASSIWSKPNLNFVIPPMCTSLASTKSVHQLPLKQVLYTKVWTFVLILLQVGNLIFFLSPSFIFTSLSSKSSLLPLYRLPYDKKETKAFRNSNKTEIHFPLM